MLRDDEANTRDLISVELQRDVVVRPSGLSSGPLGFGNFCFVMLGSSGLGFKVYRAN